VKLITYEFRMEHIHGPKFDWWVVTDKRVSEAKVEAEVARMEASDHYRNILVDDDPHDNHHGTIETSASGLAQRCTVPGCTWSWDYD